MEQQPANEKSFETIDLSLFQRYDKKNSSDTMIKVLERSMVISGKVEQFVSKKFAVYVNPAATIMALQESEEGFSTAQQGGSANRRSIVCKAAIEALKANPKAINEETPLVWDSLANCWVARFERHRPLTSSGAFNKGNAPAVGRLDDKDT
jgi:hypothetical protein